MSESMASVRTRVSAAEWEQRVQLAACYRLVAQFGWDGLIFTPISARVPGPEHHFLMNPYGLRFGEITASSLVKVDLEGHKPLDSPADINPAGFTIHSAIHAAREDAHCVLPVHSVNGVAVSAQAGGVLPVSQHAMFVLSSLAYHAYEGVALEADEKPRLVRDLEDKHFLMLHNRGLLTVARLWPKRSWRCISSRRPAGSRCGPRPVAGTSDGFHHPSLQARRRCGNRSRGALAAGWRGRPYSGSWIGLTRAIAPSTLAGNPRP